LYLRTISSSNVGYTPTSFFADALFGSAQKVEQTWQNRAVKDHLRKSEKDFQIGNIFLDFIFVKKSYLCLAIISCYDVSNSSQSSRDNPLKIELDCHFKFYIAFH